MKKQIQQGLDVVLYVNDIPVAGQLGVTLNRSQNSIDITNQINGQWSESLAGLKTWSLDCSGVYIKNQESYNLLEEAFMNDTNIQVKFSMGNKQYTGDCLITSFPLQSNYNKRFKYSIKLLGNGELR